MMSLTPENNLRNPWFEEYWEDFFTCTLAKNYPVIFEDGKQMKLCDKDLRLSEKDG